MSKFQKSFTNTEDTKRNTHDKDTKTKSLMIKPNNNFFISRTYAKTLYIAHDNFDELHYSHVRSPNYFYSKTFSFSSQITFILIEGCFNWSVRYFDNNPCLT